MLLQIVLIIHLAKYLSRFFLLTDSRSIVAFSKPGAFWVLQMRNKEKLHAVLKRNSLLTHFLLVLNFEAEQSLRFRLVLTPESIGFHEYRRLLVFLLHSNKE